MNCKIDFKSGSKANFAYTIMGNSSPTTEVDYEVHGKEVTIKNSPWPTLVGTIADDGCVDFSGIVGKLCKE